MNENLRRYLRQILREAKRDPACKEDGSNLIDVALLYTSKARKPDGTRLTAQDYLIALRS